MACWAGASHESRGASPREERGGQELHDDGERKHEAPVHAIGELARRDREEERRHELREAHQAQVPRARGEVVHLPAQGDQQHLVAHRGQAARPQEEVEAARQVV
jgi:hypothetical protein